MEKPEKITLGKSLGMNNKVVGEYLSLVGEDTPKEVKKAVGLTPISLQNGCLGNGLPIRGKKIS